MAKSDILVRMVADTKNYDANIAKAKKTLDGFTQDNFTAGGALKQMSSQLVATAAKFASFGAAVAGAMKLAKDAFMSNEQQLDEWGRTVESVKSIYNGFLDSINTGDIAGYLTNMDRIVSAARAAYDAMDELNTFNAFNQRNVARTHREMTEAMVAVREGRGTKEEAKAAGAAYKQQLEERRKLEKQAYEDYIRKVAAERNVSSADLMKAMSGSYGDYSTLKNTPLSGTRYKLTGMASMGGVQTSVEKYAVNETERLGEALRRLNDTELQHLQALGAQADRTGDEIAQVDRTIARYVGWGRSGGGGGGGGAKGTATQYVVGGIAGAEVMSGVGFEANGAVKSLNQLNIELKRYQELMERATTATAYNSASMSAASVQKRIGAQGSIMALGIDSESKAEIYAEMEAFGEELRKNLKPIEIKVVGKDLEKVGEKTEDAWNSAASAVASVGSALQNINDPGAKVASIIAEAIANIALGMAKASSQDWKLGTWGWIASAAAGVATMVSTIASIKSATAGSYAEGGIVPGNSYSGDKLTANVNSGELILNAAQQDSLASMLQGGGGGGSAQPYVSGEQIYLGVTNYLRRSGRGEIVTTR